MLGSNNRPLQTFLNRYHPTDHIIEYVGFVKEIFIGIIGVRIFFSNFDLVSKLKSSLKTLSSMHYELKNFHMGHVTLKLNILFWYAYNFHKQNEKLS